MIRLNAITNNINENKYSSLHTEYVENISSAVKRTILKSGFFGVWSQTVKNCISPPPRKDCFSVKSEKYNGMFIGYGIDEQSNLYNDLWFLSFDNFRWQRIRLSGDVVSPRTGSRAIMLGNNIIVFGGFAKQEYYADLHRIDITTGKVYQVPTSGDAPDIRCSPVIAFYNRCFYVWGGFNVNEYPKDLFVLSLENFEWTRYPQNIKGRAGVPYVQIDNEVIIYSGRDNSAMIVIDLAKKIVSARTMKGSAPSNALRSGMMASYKKYIFFIGGKSQSTDKYMLLYALDLEKDWWFVFHVNPDGVTTSADDGTVTETKIFFLPRVVGGALAFDENRKELIYTLGLPESDPPIINRIYIGDAIGILNQREDMLNALRF